MGKKPHHQRNYKEITSLIPKFTARREEALKTTVKDDPNGTSVKGTEPNSNGTISQVESGRTYSDDVDFHEWLYNPETDAGKYSLTTRYELAKLTISWYNATNNRDRQSIGTVLQLVQRNTNIHYIKETVKSVLSKITKITPITEAILAEIEGGQSLESLDNQVLMCKDIEDEIHYLGIGSIKEIGQYEDVGGHHIHAKSAFRDNINYSPMRDGVLAKSI